MSRVLILGLRQPAGRRRPVVDGRGGNGNGHGGGGVGGVDGRAGNVNANDGIANGVPEIVVVGGGGGGGGSEASINATVGGDGGDVGGRRERGRRRWGSSRPFFLGFLSVAPPTRVRPSPSGIMHTPEMLIFALGLAALLSLIVFICDMLSERPLRPMSLLVFISAGTYCIVLIKRQRALASAEQELMMEIMQASAAESSRRVLSKEDRRTLFQYFTFHSADAGEGGRVTGKPWDTRGCDASVASCDSLARRALVEGGGSEKGRRIDISGESSPPVCGEPRAGATGPVDVESDDARGAAGIKRPTLALRGAATVACSSSEVGVSSAAAVAACSDFANDFPSVPESSQRSGLEDATSSAVDAAGAGRRCSRCNGVVGSSRGCGCGGCLESGKNKKADEVEVEEKDAPSKGLVRGDSCREWSTGGSCVVCFAEYSDGDDLCRLPCRHIYHAQCIDEWLDGANHAWCPLCKRDLTGDSQDNPSCVPSAEHAPVTISETAAGEENTGESAV